jgi:ubiquinone/menaquinone biosynthesis C-methylase UbiE
VNNNLSQKKSDAYYEAAGLPIMVLSIYDFYRYKKVKKYLYGKSVMDYGPGKADFLNIIKSDYEIAGIEMNIERVKLCNQILGQNAVRLGNIQDGLDYKDNSFDTITCMEVLEHLDDPKKALEELVRVSRKRVIITVPFNEKIRYVLCIHCAKYTPYSGHLHSFNESSISEIIPQTVRITKIELCSNKLLRRIPYFNRIIFKAPQFISSTLDNLINHIFPKANWMIIILDKNTSTDSQKI